VPRVLVTCGEIVVAGAIDNSYTCCQGDLSAKGCQVAEVHNSFNLICSVVDTGTIHSDFVVFYNYFIEKNNNTCYCSIYAYFNQCFINKSALPCIQMCRSVERRKRLIFISVSQCDFLCLPTRLWHHQVSGCVKTVALSLTCNKGAVLVHVTYSVPIINATS